MPNMSYCRFENTMGHLRACNRAMYDPTDGMNEQEAFAREELFCLIQDMADEIAAMSKGDRRNGNAEKHEDRQYT